MPHLEIAEYFSSWKGCDTPGVLLVWGMIIDLGEIAESFEILVKSC